MNEVSFIDKEVAVFTNENLWDKIVCAKFLKLDLISRIFLL